MQNTKVRPLKKSELPFLQEMLYHAIFVPEGEAKLPKEIITQPDLAKYIANFGEGNDFCLVADHNDKTVGAIWIRTFTSANKGYGFIDGNTPELSIAVMENYQNKGIGTQLLLAMLTHLKQKPFKQVSLSVDKANYAYAFYQKHGFTTYSTADKSVIMVRLLQ